MVFLFYSHQKYRSISASFPIRQGKESFFSFFLSDIYCVFFLFVFFAWLVCVRLYNAMSGPFLSPTTTVYTRLDAFGSHIKPFFDLNLFRLNCFFSVTHAGFDCYRQASFGRLIYGQHTDYMQIIITTR